MKLFTIIVILSLFLLAGCNVHIDPNQPMGMIRIKGSDTIVNAEQMVSEEFMKDYPQVFVAVTGGGSGVGIASLINKNCDIAGASREMSKKEINMAQKRGVNPFEIVVAYDGVAVIVNNNNPVDKLTIDELRKLFIGEITNWKELGGQDVPVVTLSREVSSGTHAYFKEQVIHLGNKLSKEEFSPKTLLLSSSQAIVEEVSNNPGAVGYLGMGYISDRTKPLALSKTGEEYYPPVMKNVLDGTYPLSRPLYFYTDNEPNGVIKLFVDYALSEKGQRAFEDSGFVPMRKNVARKN